MERQGSLPPATRLDRASERPEVSRPVPQLQVLQPVQHLADAARQPGHVLQPGRGPRLRHIAPRASQQAPGGLAEVPRTLPPGRDRAGCGGSELAGLFQRHTPLQMPGAGFEEGRDGAGLLHDAGIAGEHRVDGLLYFRRKARLAPEGLGAVPERLP